MFAFLLFYYFLFFIILCNLWRVWKQSKASQSVSAHSFTKKEKFLQKMAVEKLKYQLSSLKFCCSAQAVISVLECLRCSSSASNGGKLHPMETSSSAPKVLQVFKKIWCLSSHDGCLVFKAIFGDLPKK